MWIPLPRISVSGEMWSRPLKPVPAFANIVRCWFGAMWRSKKANHYYILNYVCITRYLTGFALTMCNGRAVGSEWEDSLPAEVTMLWREVRV
jgi:hypothetical protein